MSDQVPSSKPTMDRIFKLRESIAGYFSPANRRRSLGTPRPAAGRSGSGQVPGSAPVGRKSQAVVAARVSKKYLSPSDTRKKNRKRQIREQDYEFESDTESSNELDTPEPDPDFVLRPEDSVSQDPTVDLDEDDEDDRTDRTAQTAADRTAAKSKGDKDDNEEDDPEPEPQLTAEEKVTFFLDHQAEIARVNKAVSEIEEQEWHPDEVALYRKLSLRGLEPLLPAHWKLDFRTCPPQLFSANEDAVFINSHSGREFRATNALQSLLTLGGRVRDLKMVRKRPEKLVKKELKRYVKWAEQDGGYDTRVYVPVLAIVADRPRQDITELSELVEDQLNFLALRHRQALAWPAPGRINKDGEVEMFRRRPPIVYGIIITGAIFVFVTLDSSDPNAKVRTIADFNFNDKNLDVWNGFALAIIIIAARNYMISIKNKLRNEAQQAAADPDA